MTLNPKKFSFIESLTRDSVLPVEDRHFRQIFKDLERLEQWLKENKIENNWDLKQKLAFLRSVESKIRTATAVRRTQLSWFTLAIGTLAATIGILISLL